MNKALMTMALAGLLTGTAYLASAQQEGERQPARPEAQDRQRPSGDDVFARLDGDGNGKLSEEEFSRAFASQATDEQKKKTFTEWDADGDDSISKDEFMDNYAPGGE